MDSLFGIPLTSIMTGLLILLALSLSVLAWVGWRQPLLMRMGLRNIRRRPAQTTLIVVGLMLSTLIISAAFATGDTVGYSITNQVYRSLQGTDLVLAFDPDRAEVGRPQHLTDADVARFRADFEGNSDIDGITSGVELAAPALNEAQRLSEPASRLVGVDPATIGPFEGLKTLAGDVASAEAIGPGRAYITESLAESIAATAGDSVTVFFDNQPHRMTVVAVIQNVSSALADSEGPGPGGTDAVVTTLAAARAISGEPDELTSIGVSVVGGVRGTLERAERVETQVDAYLEGNTIPAQTAITKPQAVRIANLVGSLFVTFFLLFGLFSIAAGILLIFLIFVMLAAERRSEMGMARAIGMSRLHLTESFLAEGMAYNVGSAAVGALLGLVVSYLLIAVLRVILGAAIGDFSLAFHVNPQGVIIAYSLGVVLTFATVSFSAWRAANVNIVRAIRDLPEPNILRGRDRSAANLARSAVAVIWYLAWLAMASLWVVAGIALFAFGLGTFGVGIIAGILLAAWYVFGARAASRPFGALKGWQKLLYVLWWAAFNVLALLTWVLLRTRGWANRYRNAGGWAIVMLVSGIGLIYWGGWELGQAFAYTSGHTLSVLAIAMLAVYFGVSARPAFTVAGLALVWYWLLPLPFSLFPGGEGWRDPLDGLMGLLGIPPKTIVGNIEMFFVSGISITAAATLVVVFNASWFLALAGLLGRVLGGAMPAVRMAIAYPLSSRFRTGMTLSMFGLVVFSLVVMATLNHNFTQLFLGDEARAGYDVMVETNPNNRIEDLRAALAEENAGVRNRLTAVGKLTGGAGQALQQTRADGGPVAPRRNAEPGDSPFKFLNVQGANDEFLQTAELPMMLRAAGYPTDEAVIEALRSDPTVAVLDGNLLRVPGAFGDPTDRFTLAEAETELRDVAWQPVPVTVRHPETGSELQLRIIAITEPQVSSLIGPLLGLIANERNVATAIAPDKQQITFLVTVADHSKDGSEAAAREIESALLERGVQAESLEALIDEAAAASTGFQSLFEGFMGLGLIVGIAALGVIAFRTVVERRQQIGMLRAIGYTRRLVALTFFLESSFIALTGTLMGFVLGLALSYNLLTDPAFTGGTEVVFGVPWIPLAVIFGIAYGASALMTLIPARAASRVPVAEALRYE